MKIHIIIMLVLASLTSNVLAITPSHPKKITLADEPKKIDFKISIELRKGATVPPNFADTVKKAQDLLSKIFSSQEFKEELYKRSYHDSAYSKSKKNCFDRIYDSQTGRISGKAVYDNLLAKKDVGLVINIRHNGDNRRTMGSSNACVYRITTNDYWLVEKPGLSHQLVRHWAHEFTHIRGFRHDGRVPQGYKWGRNVNEDPAYGVGTVVDIILKRWQAEGLI